VNNINIKKDFVDGKVLPAQDLNNNFNKIENGMKDLKGDSAYQVAVRNGFIGTEEEWLATLVGPQGPQGPKGNPGASGSASGYIKGTMLHAKNNVAVGFRGSLDVEDYTIDTNNNLPAYIADSPEKDGLGAPPRKGIYINTKELSLLKVHVKGEAFIMKGDSNRFQITTMIRDFKESPTFGRNELCYKDLSQLVNRESHAYTLIEHTGFFDVSQVDSIIIYTKLQAQLYDNLGETSGTCSVNPFEFFIEGYK
jgi:acid stress-induced BolA-like protein IbaG/YrbA